MTMTAARPRSRGEVTRERILEIAEGAVLAKGFSNTSIDEIIAAAGITKSGFFYHFSDKTDLAKGLLERFIADDTAKLDAIFRRATELSDDPLHAFLIGLKMFAEMMGDMERTHPGCMVAAIAYHDKQFNEEVRLLNARAVLGWRTRFLGHLEAIAAVYPPKVDINLRHLADMVSALGDGGIISERVLGEPGLLAEQVMLLRTFVKLVFLGTGQER
jgi:TetR/AcrR family transcriptional regulator, transcriptional repressor for nem operon